MIWQCWTKGGETKGVRERVVDGVVSILYNNQLHYINRSIKLSNNINALDNLVYEVVIVDEG